MLIAHALISYELLKSTSLSVRVRVEHLDLSCLIKPLIKVGYDVGSLSLLLEFWVRGSLTNIFASNLI